MNRIFFILTFLLLGCSGTDENIVESWPNGNPKIISKQISKSNTLATEYYESGQIKSEGELQETIKTGPWKEWFKNGKLKSQKIYNHGSLFESFEEYHSNGKTNSKGSFDQSGKLDGEFVSYHENGSKKSQGKYSNGAQIEDWNYWNDSGSKIKNITYYFNGYPKTEEEITENGIIWRSFFQGGKMEEKGNIKDGMRIGEWTKHWELGGIHSKGKYKNNNQRGSWEYWYRDGKKRAEFEYSEKEEIIKNYWLPSGKQTLKNGNGEVHRAKGYNYNLIGTGVYKKGKFVKNLKQ